MRLEYKPQPYGASSQYGVQADKSEKNSCHELHLCVRSLVECNTGIQEGSHCPGLIYGSRNSMVKAHSIMTRPATVCIWRSSQGS